MRLRGSNTPNELTAIVVIMLNRLIENIAYPYVKVQLIRNDRHQCRILTASATEIAGRVTMRRWSEEEKSGVCQETY
jgi:5-hydroxyisourate hydrolase-like protein (transthyretin family)